MLVISRKNGQKIMINDNIVITIVDVKNGSCKIAIEDDKDVKIYREEIYYQIKLANLIGKDTNVNTVDSVSDMLMTKDVKLNTESLSSKHDEEIIDKPKGKSIIIRKNAPKNDL